MAKFIVAIETVKIKEFLFSTNKLKVIRGASYLLDYLNQVEVPKILKKEGRVKEENIIYVGAGNAKFFLERDSKEEAEKVVKEIIAEVKEKYEREAPGAKVIGVYVETQYTKGQKSKEGKEVWNDLDELEKKTAIEKNKGFTILNIDLPHIEKCELSGTEVAEVSIDNFTRDLVTLGFLIENGKLIFKKFKNDRECSIEIGLLKKQVMNLAKTSGKISEASFRKILFANLLKIVDKDDEAMEADKINNVGFYNTIKEYIRDYEDSAIQDFQDNDSFFGVMYSDGDGLGDFLKGTKTKFIELLEKKDNAEDLYLKFMGEFSKELDKTTKQSLKDVLEEVFKNRDEKEKWGEFLIVGGDDVCAVFSPNLVIEISMKFQKRFEEEMDNAMAKITERLGKNMNTRITSSSGIIIAKAKTPIFQLFEQAINLQKSAKKARKKAIDLNLNKTGFIDFQVIGSEGCVDIDEFRKKLEDNKVMERPYAISIEKGIFKNIEELLNLIKEMKNISFPTNKLRYIYDLKVDRTKVNFEKKMELINILSKMKKEQIEFVRDKLGIKIKYDSEQERNEKIENDFKDDFINIFDVLEIYNFIE